MTSEYSEYLQSQIWKAKRIRAIALYEGRCAACGGKDQLQVHHLTYAHIFHEPLSDLLVLCKLHHLAAEEMIAMGSVKRQGDPAKLAVRTLDLIAPEFKRVRQKKAKEPRPKRRYERKVKCITKGRPSPYELQQRLLNLPEFVSVLIQDNRRRFISDVRLLFSGDRAVPKILEAALALFDRPRR